MYIIWIVLKNQKQPQALSLLSPQVFVSKFRCPNIRRPPHSPNPDKIAFFNVPNCTGFQLPRLLLQCDIVSAGPTDLNPVPTVVMYTMNDVNSSLSVCCPLETPSPGVTLVLLSPPLPPSCLATCSAVSGTATMLITRFLFHLISFCIRGMR